MKMGELWFHVDMDAFYASVEQLDNPSLKGLPVIVGGRSNRGVVAACSYEARKYKVHSAMPIYQAKKLCPQAVCVPPRMKRYNQVSRQVFNLLNSFSPTVQQISIDEAFLEMSGTERLFGKPRQAAILLKNRIRNELGLTISVGVASSKFIAKMASGYDKPDGLCIVSLGKEATFVETIGLKKLWGLGESTLASLEKHNIRSVEKLREYEEQRLQQMFGSSAGSYLYKVCRGIDPGIHTGITKSRSISTEMTFSVDVTALSTLNQNLLAMSHEIMFRSLEENLYSSTVAIKIRYSDFSTFTVQSTTDSFIKSAEQIYAIAKELLLQKWDKGRAVRLLGVGLYNLKENQEAIQQVLFDDPFTKKRDLEKVVLDLRSKGKSLQKASLLEIDQDDDNF
jgi:DNA polymerase-4